MYGEAHLEPSQTSGGASLGKSPKKLCCRCSNGF